MMWSLPSVQEWSRFSVRSVRKSFHGPIILRHTLRFTQVKQVQKLFVFPLTLRVEFGLKQAFFVLFLVILPVRREAIHLPLVRLSSEVYPLWWVIASPQDAPEESNQAETCPLKGSRFWWIKQKSTCWGQLTNPYILVMSRFAGSASTLTMLFLQTHLRTTRCKTWT